MHWLIRAAARERGPIMPGVLERWLEREVLDPETFYALADEKRARAFTIKGDAWQDMLTDVRDSITAALRDGVPQGEWAKDLWPKIADRYGAQGAAVAARMDVIFRTNALAAYAGGRYAAMFRPDWIERAPYVRYRAILDTRTRDTHRALNGKILKKSDPYARPFFPPTGFGCRCGLEELTEEDVRAGGWTVTEGHTLFTDPAIGPPPKGWDTDRVAALVDESLKARFFGPPDPAVTERIIRRYEDDLRKIKGHEEAIAFDEYGLVRWRGKGPANAPSVKLPPPPEGVDVAGLIVTHNHPDGNAVSPGDFVTAVSKRLAEVRTVTSGWLYSIRPVGEWVRLDAISGALGDAWPLAEAVIPVTDKGFFHQLFLEAKRWLDLDYRREPAR